MNRSAKALRILLWIAAIYHLALGFSAMVLKTQATDLARIFFKFNLSPTPELLWLLNPFSAYLLAFGVMLAITATNPLRYRPFLFIAVGLFCLRAIQRAWFLMNGPPELKVITDSAQNGIHLAVVAAMAIGMTVLAMQIKPVEPGR